MTDATITLETDDYRLVGKVGQIELEAENDYEQVISWYRYLPATALRSQRYTIKAQFVPVNGVMYSLENKKRGTRVKVRLGE